MMRNPFSLLISMQLKQAALAANDYGADIFTTESWKSFATSGIKAWYAHTRGWLCSKIEDILLVHYEKVIENFNDGKTRLNTGPSLAKTCQMTPILFRKNLMNFGKISDINHEKGTNTLLIFILNPIPHGLFSN